MVPIRKILCPTDFSDSARPAFDIACAMARTYRAALAVIHVVAPASARASDGISSPFPIEGRYGLRARLVHDLPTDPDIGVEYHVLEGAVDERILEAARDVAADVIVMGTHGRGGLTRLLLGSAAESVVRRAPCPVLTVRGPLSLPPLPVADEQSRPPTGAA